MKISDVTEKIAMVGSIVFLLIFATKLYLGAYDYNTTVFKKDAWLGLLSVYNVFYFLVLPKIDGIRKEFRKWLDNVGLALTIACIVVYLSL